MSIFGSIASAIFGSHKTAPAPEQLVTPIAGASAGANSIAAPTGPAVSASAATATAAASAPVAAAAGAVAAQAASVDVAKVLDGLKAKSREALDWRKSIVDLMKLLNLDSGLAARKELAKELHYSGDMGDSAAMNVWLHKQVMTKLAENGGIVPAEFKH